jgi:heavy metal translocating P-type ATPase
VIKENTLVDLPTETLSFRVMGMTCTGCENTLYAALMGHPGVYAVETSMFLERATVTFDPTVVHAVSLMDVITKKAGFKAYLESVDDVSTVKLVISGTLPVSMDTILKPEAGIHSYHLTPYEHDGQYDQILEVKLNLDMLGARNVSDLLSSHGISSDILSTESKKQNEWNMDQIRLIVAILCSIPVAFLAWIFPSSLEQDMIPTVSIKVFIMWICATIVQTFVAWPIYMGAWNGLVQSKELNMDSLVVLSTGVAYVYSTISVLVGMALNRTTEELFFETSVILLALIVLGRFLQSIARKKAADTFDGLRQVHSDKVWIIEEGQTREIESKWIQRGDLVLIRPFDRIPSDGIVVEGCSDVDESIITGESIPVCKKINDRVIGSTTNTSGKLTIRITHLQSENMVSHISRLIQQAQGSKAKTQYLADQLAAWFTPLVIVLAMAVYMTWYLLGYHNVVPVESHPALYALGYAIAVLVVSCPCAVALAVPTVIVVGAGVAAKFGLLVKNAEMFEDVCRCNVILFDKTGTLTLGQPQVIQFAHNVSDLDWERVKSYIRSGCVHSLHPISKAIALWCQQHSETSSISVEATEIVETAGSGISFSVGSDTISIGRVDFVSKELDPSLVQASNEFKEKGYTLAFVSLNHKAVCVFALSDPLRPEAIKMVQRLLKQKYQVYMVSGDNQITCTMLGHSLGIPVEHIMGERRPDEKLKTVQELQGQGNNVLFVGDGTNDAPVLAQANVGIAMGTATSVALQSSAVILLSNDLQGVQTMIDLSNQVLYRIKLNFLWAAIYNAIAIPLTAGVFAAWDQKIRIPPALAGFGEIVSVMPVLIVALLLRNFRI